MRNPPCWKSITTPIVVYRRSWKEIFTDFHIKTGKTHKRRTQTPVESAAAEEIKIGGLRHLFLEDFHKLLGKQKTLSTLTTGPTTIHKLETIKSAKLKPACLIRPRGST